MEIFYTNVEIDAAKLLNCSLKLCLQYKNIRSLSESINQNLLILKKTNKDLLNFINT